MRGASALGTLLAAHPKTRLRLIVIWLPVIRTDIGPPTDEVRRPLQDPRVVEYWDPDHWVSPRMIERARLMARARGQEDHFQPYALAWDVILRYSSEAPWEDPFPTPVWSGGPVADVLGRVEETLSGAR